MKRFLALTLPALALLVTAGPTFGQDSTREELRRELTRELEEAGQGLLEKIVAVAEAKIQAARKAHKAELDKLREAIAARDKEIAELKTSMDSLRKELAAAEAKVPVEPKAFLGILHITPGADLRSGLDLAEGEGAQVTGVVPGGPAAKAGIQAGDVIVAVGEKSVGSKTLAPAVATVAPGSTVKLQVLRGSEKMVVDVRAVGRDEFQDMVQKAAAAARAPQPEPEAPKAVLGILVEEKDTGLEIQNVEEDLTGDVAKLAVGDVIRKVNGKPVKTLDDLKNVLGGVRVGNEMSIEVARDKATIAARVVAGGAKGEAKLLELTRTEPEKPATPEPKPEPKPERKPAFLGVTVEQGDDVVRVISVVPESAAGAYGLKEGDVIRRVGDREVKTIADLREAVGNKISGDTLALVVDRGDKRIEISSMKLGAKGEKVAAPEVAAPVQETKSDPAPEPKPEERAKGYLGILAQETESDVRVSEVAEGSPAARAALMEGDVILKVNDVAIKTFDDMIQALRGKYAGDSLDIVVKRDGKEVAVKVELGEDSGA